MSIFILILLIIATGSLGAYTFSFQETTHSIGKKLAPYNDALPTGLQDAITPRSQNIRNIIFPFMMTTLLIYSLFITEWYYAVLIVIFTFVFVITIIKPFLPKSESKHYINIIENDLKRRLKEFEARNNKSGIEAATSVIKKLHEL